MVVILREGTGQDTRVPRCPVDVQFPARVISMFPGTRRNHVKTPAARPSRVRRDPVDRGSELIVLLPAGKEEMVMSTSTPATPRPLAVAVVAHAPSASEYERSCARLAVMERAREEGYCVAELFELMGTVEADRGVWSRAGELIAGKGIGTVFLSGVPDRPECLSGLAVVEVLVVLGSRELLLRSAVGWSEGCEGGGLR
jgi:hypothetical protein